MPTWALIPKRLISGNTCESGEPEEVERALRPQCGVPPMKGEREHRRAGGGRGSDRSTVLRMFLLS